MVRTRHYSGRNKERSEEATRVLYGVETVVNTVLQFIDKTNNKIDACIDQTRPSLLIDIAVLKEAFLDAKKRGVYLRYVTEITKDNLSYCKELMTMVGELRHLDGIKGNIYVSEIGYLAPATFHERRKPAAQIIYSNVKEIVEHQTYVFDTLWTRAIPAEERFEQIEEGAGHEFVQVITNPQKTSRILSELIKFAKEEILLFLANDKALDRIDKLGLIDHIIKISQETDTTIKIITPLNQKSSEIVNRINKMAPSIRILNSDNNSAFGMCIIDGEKLLRVELRQSDTDDFSEATDFAIYSNRKLTVHSFKSIFELLWNERILNEQLKVHDKMQSEFINIAAHELRTPIQAILGYSELLKEDKSKKNPLHFITPIFKNAQRLEKLANDILDVTRIENKQLKLNLERFNIVDLVSDIVQDLENNNANAITSKETNHRASSRKELVQLTYEAAEDIIFVEADKARITRVISNLLNNAIKFTRRGLISVKCRREYKTDETNNSHHENAIITIKDTGSGISRDIFHRLFTKFATNSNSGTGLGLFISKNIIEAHGGRIWAENNQNESGASFSFSLPIDIAKNSGR